MDTLRYTDVLFRMNFKLKFNGHCHKLVIIYQKISFLSRKMKLCFQFSFSYSPKNDKKHQKLRVRHKSAFLYVWVCCNFFNCFTCYIWFNMSISQGIQLLKKFQDFSNFYFHGENFFLKNFYCVFGCHILFADKSNNFSLLQQKPVQKWG